MNTTLADSNDHDPVIGVSDGMSFVGFQAHDKDNYGSWSPCVHAEGLAEGDDTKLQNIHRVNPTPFVASQHYSSEIKIQIRTCEKWGACHTEHDEGYTNIANYQRDLDLSNGLYLEMYRQGKQEKYHIKYIKVGIEY